MQLPYRGWREHDTRTTLNAVRLWIACDGEYTRYVRHQLPGFWVADGSVAGARLGPYRASALFWFNLRVTILVAILMLLMAPVLVWFFGEPRLLMITTVMTFGVAVAALSNQHEAMLIREARFEALVKWDVAFLFCGVLTAIVAAAAGLGYWALVVQHLVWQIGRATAIWIVCGWIPVRPSRLGDTARSIRGLVSFGAYLTGFRVDDAS